MGFGDFCVCFSLECGLVFCFVGLCIWLLAVCGFVYFLWILGILEFWCLFCWVFGALVIISCILSELIVICIYFGSLYIFGLFAVFYYYFNSIWDLLGILLDSVISCYFSVWVYFDGFDAVWWKFLCFIVGLAHFVYYTRYLNIVCLVLVWCVWCLMSVFVWFW